MFIPTDALLQAMMVNELDATPGAGALTGLDIQLFTNSPVLNRTTVLADLTTPAYAGYANLVGVVFGALHRRDDGGWCVDSPLTTWDMNDNVLPTTIMGYGIFLPAGTVLYGAEYLPAPVTLTTTLDLLNLITQFCLGGTDWGQCTVIP